MIHRTSLLWVSLLGASCDVDGSAASPADTDGSSASASGTTAGVLCSESYSVFNDDESVDLESIADWTCQGETRSLIANGVPDHQVGTFPNPENPNTISEQSVEVDFPLSPEIASEEGIATQVPAWCLNGVKIEVGTAGTCNDAGDCSAIGNGGTWRMEAVGDNGFDFGTDENHAHVQPTGAYHYHGVPERYLEALGRGEAMTLVGWAVDGFPIYARYGLRDPMDPSSDVVVIAASYVLADAPATGRPSTDIYPLGAFTQDWVYEAGSGDLDECNGRTGVTPEFPDGIYHYYLTDGFPFGQRCVKGTALAGAGSNDGPPGGGPPGGGPP